MPFQWPFSILAATIDVVVFATITSYNPNRWLVPRLSRRILPAGGKLGVVFLCIQQPVRYGSQLFCILPGQCGNATHTLHCVSIQAFRKRESDAPWPQPPNAISPGFWWYRHRHLSDKFDVWLKHTKIFRTSIPAKTPPVLPFSTASCLLAGFI